MANRFFESTAHAAVYAKFRPTPPPSLLGHIVSFLKGKLGEPLMAAADVGCGSGQSTEILSPYFESVTGLDVSEAQVTEARKKKIEANVSYLVSPCEKLPFPTSSLSLVTACQATHWFDLPSFYKEVDRVLMPGGVLAVYGYLFPKPVHEHLTDDLSSVIDHIYTKETGGYWGSGRLDVDSAYSDEKFVIPYPDFFRDDSHYIDKVATVAEVTGYITSWSGFQNFHKTNGDAAAQEILTNFQESFMRVLDVSTPPEDTTVHLRFHYFLLMASKPKECV